MPTVGWIREDNLEAYYDGTQRTPDRGVELPPRYACPFCAEIGSNQQDLQRHIYAKHRVDRPLVLINGKEPATYRVFRAPLSVADITLANTSSAELSINGKRPEQVPTQEVAASLAAMQQAEITLDLVNETQPKAAPVTSRYSFSFRVSDDTALTNVETAFADLLVSSSLTREVISAFLTDVRTQGTGREYASGLANYCLGILIKERPQAERLTTPLSRYRELYGSALEILRDFNRPLARVITALIQFSMNDFRIAGRRTGYWELDLATELLLDPDSRHLPPRGRGTRRRPFCPVDHATARMLELACHLLEQRRWSPVLDAECRALTVSDVMDNGDHQKAFAIWAASAWRLGAISSVMEPLTQIAEVYPFSRWANKFLEQVST